MAAPSTPTHRVACGVVSMRAVATDLSEVPAWSLTEAEAVATLSELTRLEAQVAELKLRVLARVDQGSTAADAGASSTANWFAHTTTVTRRGAHREMRLARGLAGREATRAALAAGGLQVDQAAVMVRALGDLPEDLDPALALEAEAHLIGEAKRFDAKHLAVLATHVLEVICPEVGEAHTAALLEREERHNTAAQRLTLWEDGRGRTHVRAVLDRLHGAMLKKMLHATAAPRHQAAVHGTARPGGERRPTPERLGAAFAELIERYPTEKLPNTGGLNACVVATMTLETLMGGLQAAQLDTGGEISAALARRLACEAGIIPAVLGGRSEVLDLGRSQRFHTKAQRIAAGLEQQHCNTEGCDWPPAMCHLHHPTPWSEGGGTNRDGMLLCPHHHTRAHDTNYQTTTLPTGRVQFHRRT